MSKSNRMTESTSQHDQDTAIDLSEGAGEFSGSELPSYSQSVKQRNVPTSYDSIHVERPVYSLAAFNTTHQYDPPKAGCKDVIKRTYRKKCKPSARCCAKFLLGFFPFIGIFRRYKLKRDLIGDIVSGLTVGVMHIPQGLAYGMLTNLPAVYGLYCSFFPVIVYFFLGTSRHISLGTFAVVSLMVGNVVLEFQSVCQDEAFNTTAAELTNDTLSSDSKAETLCKVGVAMACTFVVGLIQFGLGLFRFGFVTVYLSEPLTRAFITGSAFHVATSQMKHALGINPGKHTGILKVILTWIDLSAHILETNIAALITTVITIVLIYCSQRWLNPIVKQKCKGIPLPNELILIVLGTIISYFADFHEIFDMNIVGDVPTGFPPPTLPQWHRIPYVAVDAVSIAIVAFAVNISMAKSFAKKHAYKLDSNQELLAYGTCNIVGSMLNSYVSAASLSRSIIQERVGGVTQLAGLISCCLLAIVLLAVGPLLHHLPNSVLAGIILINLKGVFMQIADLKRLYNISKWDMLVWILTFSAVVIADVDIGLLVGVVVSLLTIVFRAQTPQAYRVGRLGDTEMYGSFKDYSTMTDRRLASHGIRVFRFSAPLCYANSEYFTQRLISTTSCDPVQLRALREEQKEQQDKVVNADTPNNSETKNQNQSSAKPAAGLPESKPSEELTKNGNSDKKFSSEISLQSVHSEKPTPGNSGVEKPVSKDDSSNGTVEAKNRTGDKRVRNRGMSPSETSKFLKSTDEDDDDEYYSIKRTEEGVNGHVREDDDDDDDDDDVLKCDIRCLIIDCAAMAYVDAMGLETLKATIEDYAAVSVQVFLASCSNSVYELLRKDGAFESCENEVVFVSVHDAVSAALSEFITSSHQGTPVKSVNDKTPQNSASSPNKDSARTKLA